MISLTESAWIVTIFKCDADKVKDVLVNFYEFIRDIEEVQDLHFLIRDRLKDMVVLSFRIKIDVKDKIIITSKIRFKIKSLIPEQNFVIGPSPDHPLFRYEAWPWKKTLEKRGLVKFEAFCHFLNKLSAVVIEMAKQDYFSSEERMEMAHVMSWMLGCVEKTALMPQKKINSVLTGLYDRIDQKFFSYSKQDYLKSE
jgi:hypothetical protein